MRDEVTGHLMDLYDIVRVLLIADFYKYVDAPSIVKIMRPLSFSLSK